MGWYYLLFTSRLHYLSFFLSFYLFLSSISPCYGGYISITATILTSHCSMSIREQLLPSADGRAWKHLKHLPLKVFPLAESIFRGTAPINHV